MQKAKVTELNLEAGSPDPETAVIYMKNSLSTYRKLGLKAVIVIHGYGSTGEGGKIKTAARSALLGASMRGIVRSSLPGENWMASKKAFLDACPALREHERHISGNQGVTVVLLR